jgi:uncharacterized protein YdhG (YjbR/CyaY superfamily)
VAGTAPDIDSYIAAAPETARATLNAMRKAIQAAVPDAVESIGYGMPTFKYRGRALAYLGAWKGHCALYGMALDPHREALAAYVVEKGTIRFPHGTPLPEALVRRLLESRVAEIEAAARKKAARGR